MSREKAGSGCGQGGHGGCRGPATKPSAEAGMGGGGCRQAQWRTKAGAGAVGGVVGGGHHRWYHLLQAPTQCHHAPPASQAGPAVACSRPRQAGQQATAPLLTPAHWSLLLLLLLPPPSSHPHTDPCCSRCYCPPPHTHSLVFAAAAAATAPPPHTYSPVLVATDTTAHQLSSSGSEAGVPH